MIVEYFGDKQIGCYKDLKQLEDCIIDRIWIYTKGRNMSPLRGKNLLKFQPEYYKGHYFLQISLTTLISNKYRQDRLKDKENGYDTWYTIWKYGTLIVKVYETGSIDSYENRPKPLPGLPKNPLRIV